MGDVAGLPLQPDHAAEHILALYADEPGPPIKRSVIIKAVIDRHLELGGIEPSSPSARSRSVKKALSSLRDQGLADNSRQQGFYHFRSSRDVPFPESNAGFITPIAPSGTVEIGTGDQTVYAYYFPHYRTYARKDGRYQMKIGYAEGDALSRITSQGTTAMPEDFVLALVWHTSQGEASENLLHLILDFADRRCANNHAGKEWFWTSTEELQKLIFKLDALRRT